MAEVLNTSLQENVITLLCHSDEQGKVVANLIDPNLFEGEYRIIAERAIQYWHRFQEAPKAHTPDLVSEILDDPKNRKARTYERILRQMSEFAEEINHKYVLDQLRRFVRLQRTKDAILKSAERINAQQDTAVDDIEQIWHELLRSQDATFDAGLRLNDIDGLLDSLDRKASEFSIGIKVLQRNHCVPSRGTLTMFMAPAGKGKTWFLVDTGFRAAFIERKKVVHISLEVDETDIQLRYLQRAFSVPKRASEKYQVTTFDWEAGKFDKDMQKLVGFEAESVRPDFTFDSPHIRDELTVHIGQFGTRVGNLIIKRFPSGQLTMAGLRGYLDNLELTEGFIPDMVILDYPGIMKINGRYKREELGQIVIELRGLCVERNMAGVAAHQISKDGARAAVADATHVAEDWSIIGTCDNILVYSCTDPEFEHGLARVLNAKWRGERDRYMVLITQSYELGQFCLDSTYLRSSYSKLIKDLVGDDEAPEEDKEDDDRD